MINWACASVLAVATMTASFWLPSLSIKTVPPGTAYVVDAFLVGIVVLSETATRLRLLAAGLIVVELEQIPPDLDQAR